jgi:hypothetical protein
MTKRPHQRAQARRPCRLVLEPFEDRTLPTVFFTPIFGAETLVPTHFGDFNYAPLVSPNVNLIFWGSYWSTNSAQVATLESEFQAIVNSPYTSGMTDYHSAGVAFNGASHVDTGSDPPQGYDPGNGNTKDVNGNTSFSDLQTEIANNINNSASGIPAPPSDGDAIYVVVTATGTGASYNSPGQYFLPSGFPIPMEMISLSFVPNNFQGCEATFSHELIEAMSSDPVGFFSGFDQSVNVTPPADLPANKFSGSPAQICDNEPESYGYRLGGPTGQVVAPYWFNATLNGGYLLGQGNYIVPDGNSEQVTLQANWTVVGDIGTFNGNYNLLIGPVDGTVTLTAYGDGWQISINGQNFFFDPSVNPIASLTLTLGNGNDTVNVEGTNTFANNFVTINLGNGNDTVNVEGTSSLTKLLTVNLGGGTDTVNLTPTTEFLGHIEGNVTINGGAGFDTLNVNDQKSPIVQTWTLTSSTVTNLISATITYFGINQVNINGGSGNNTYDVLSTEPDFTTSLTTAGATDTVNVRVTAVSGTLDLNADGANNKDTVNIGSTAPSLGGTLANIAGPVKVSNASGHTTLNLDDSSDAGGQTVTLTNGSITGTWSPAAINYTGGQVSALNLFGGHGGNTFNVQSTAANTATSINVNHTGTQSQNNTVNIGSLAPSLGGTLANIAGPVSVSNSSGTSALVLDDSGDTTGRTVTVTNNSVNGTWSPAAIHYTGGQVSALNLLGGDGGNSFNVLSTANGTTTSINTNDTKVESNHNAVHIGSRAPSLGGTLTNIAGSVKVSNSSGTTALTLDDSGDTTVRTATITSAAVTGTWSPGAIDYTGNEVSSLTLDGGKAANTFNVQNTGTTTNLVLAGATAVKVGNAGSAQGIVGSLNIENPSTIKNTIVVDDSADTTARTVTLSTLGTNPSDSQANTDPWGQIVGLAVLGHINYEYADTSSLTIKGGGGAGTHTYNILATGSGVATSIAAGAGTNAFEVGSDGTFAGTVKKIASKLTLQGGTGSNRLTLDDSGNTTTIDTVSLTPTSAGGSGFFGTGGSLTYSAMQSVTLQSSNASVVSGSQVIGDNITVTPKSGILFTINGGNPPTGSHPGDRLTVSTVNGAVTDHPSSTTPGSGDFTFTGSTTPIVRYTGIETVQPVGWLVTAPDAGRSPEVQVFDAQSGILRFDITAFDPSFQGGVRVAVGDVNGDGIPDIITAEGPGAGTSGDSLVHVFDGITGQPLAGPLGSFDPFPGFHGGLYVAAADLTGDGYADVIVGQDAGGQGWVNIYGGQTGGLLAQFQPFGSFAGGVRLAAGPVANNGHVDLIAGAGPGGQPQVEVFDGPSLVGGLDTAVATFDAFDPRFTGGVYVAAGLIHGQGQPPGEIIVGEGAGGEPRVSVFDGTGQQLQSFLAFAPGFKGGVRVAAADVDGDGRSDNVAAEGPGGLPRVRGFDGVTLAEIDQFLAFAANFRGGVFVGGGGKWGLFSPALATSTHDGRAALGDTGANARVRDRTSDSALNLANLDALFAEQADPISGRFVWDSTSDSSFAADGALARLFHPVADHPGGDTVLQKLAVDTLAKEAADHRDEAGVPIEDTFALGLLDTLRGWGASMQSHRPVYHRGKGDQQ